MAFPDDIEALADEAFGLLGGIGAPLAVGEVTLVATLATSAFFAIQLKAAPRYQVPPMTSDGWNTASLSDTGMDDEPFNELLRRLDQDDGHNIQSLLVVKNGKLVLEVYYPGVDMIVTDNLYFIRKDFDRDTVHCLASASKSITSILFGIAMDQGYITDLDENMFANFTEYADLETGEKGEITLRQMLTMTTRTVRRVTWRAGAWTRSSGCRCR